MHNLICSEIVPEDSITIMTSNNFEEHILNYFSSCRYASVLSG